MVVGEKEGRIEPGHGTHTHRFWVCSKAFRAEGTTP